MSDTNKKVNIFRAARDQAGLTREQASVQLEVMDTKKIERIEYGDYIPKPDEVLRMARVYKKPSLCNEFCAGMCQIGQNYVPEITIKDLSQIILEMLASLNSVGKMRDRLIEIAADGVIDDSEIADFIKIQQELERISVTVEALQLWAENMLANGSINVEAYKRIMAESRKQ